MSVVSVIIIGRNEEKHIGRCVRSVLKGTETYSDCDVLFVDSASSDRSVEIAAQYPIRIVQLRPDWKLTSAAGRYIGYRNTESEYVFFIDGDTLLYRKWIPLAISFLSNNPGIAGVAGIVNELFHDDEGRIVGHRWNRYNQIEDEIDSTVFGGIALFRRSVLDRVGDYNPFLSANTDVELCLRIKKAGFKLAKIYHPMALTYSHPRESIYEISRRFRSDLYSLGTTLRYCMRSGLFWRYLTGHLRYITSFFLGVVISLIILLIALFTNEPIIALGWTATVIAGLLFYAVRRRSIRGVFISLLKRAFVTVKTLQTFITTRPKAADTYPRDVIVIQPGKKTV